jgi:hypothetical protein
MNQPFDIDQYRWLGQCTQECIDIWHPYGKHEPNWERGDIQDLIDEIDRLYTAHPEETNR